MPKNKALVGSLAVVLAVLLLAGGYAGIKYNQYLGEWKQFDAAWDSITVGATGNHASEWRPGLVSAVGEMRLSSCGITDNKLAYLKGVTTLVELDLSDNEGITDAGIEHLLTCENLRELNLRGTKVTDAGVEKLQQALPECQIAR